MSEITAAELLAMQREVTEFEKEQARLWSEYQGAQVAVATLKSRHGDARFRAEQAAIELRELERLVVSDGPQ